MKMDHNL